MLAGYQCCPSGGQLRFQGGATCQPGANALVVRALLFRADDGARGGAFVPSSTSQNEIFLSVLLTLIFAQHLALLLAEDTRGVGVGQCFAFRDASVRIWPASHADLLLRG